MAEIDTGDHLLDSYEPERRAADGRNVQRSLENAMNQTAFGMSLTYIKRFYYDTALSPSPFAMAALKELVDRSHILFGSDYPFAPGIVANMEVQALDQLKAFDATTKAGIDRGHALNLFPKYKD